MDIFLTIIKCLFYIIGVVIIFAILQGLFILLLYLPGFLNEHFCHKDDIDEEFDKTHNLKSLDKQKKVEAERDNKQTNNDFKLRLAIYNQLKSDYNMPTYLCHELSNNYPAFLYSQKRKGFIKEEEYRKGIGRWFGLIQGYFQRVPNIDTTYFDPVRGYFLEASSIDTGPFEPVDHNDPYYRDSYESSFNEGLGISMKNTKKERSFDDSLTIDP